MAYQDIVFLAGQTPDGTKVILRPLSLEDKDRCSKWINDPTLRPFLAPIIFPISYEAEEKWLEAVIRPPGNNPEDIFWAICTEAAHIGVVSLNEISLVHRHAVTGMFIAEEGLRGKGIGPTAKKLVIQYAFDELNLEYLQAEVLETNDASRLMQAKCGYKQVGCIPHWYFKDGRYQDLIIYHLSRVKWKRMKK